MVMPYLQVSCALSSSGVPSVFSLVSLIASLPQHHSISQNYHLVDCAVNQVFHAFPAAFSLYLLVLSVVL